MDGKGSYAVPLLALVWAAESRCGSARANLFRDPLGFLWKHTHVSNRTYQAHKCTYMHPPTWDNTTARECQPGSREEIKLGSCLDCSLSSVCQFTPDREWLPTIQTHSTLRTGKLFASYYYYRLFVISVFVVAVLVWPRTVQAVCFMRTCLTWILPIIPPYLP